MSRAKRLLKRIGIVLLVLILVITFGAVGLLNYKVVLARHKIDGTEEYAVSISEIHLPDQVFIAGLGEASHGNVEFQELKLSVLQNLVLNDGYSAFGLELDFGDGLALNDYVQGGTGTAKEILMGTTFPIYHTDQMAALIDWMREYNQTVSTEDGIRFYGFDMQNTIASTNYLLNYCERNTVQGVEQELSAIGILANSDAGLDKTSALAIRDSLEVIRARLEQARPAEADIEYEYALHAADTLMQAMGSFEIDGEDYMSYRDRCMAQNVDWIINLEKQIGTGKIMISAHDGHIAKSWHGGSDTFGGILAEMYGDGYFAIGTDFFVADININDSSMVSDQYTRNNHHFCSADPLAYQARYVENRMYYLDFSTIPEERQKLYSQIHKDTPMANIGEGYMWIWYLFPDTVYRPAQVPSDMYNAMIFVYKASPISVFEE